MEKQKYYITTPIYYPSGKWHIGTCYTTVVCDALARFNRLDGKDVFFLTGTDEHGQKIQRAAKEAGVTPKQYVDGLVDDLKRLWERLDITYDKFIRTTDEYHEKAVQKIFQKLYEKGDIYKSEYEGMYCVPCESFWTKSQLVDGKCPDCGREVVSAREESYFFRLSKYQGVVEKLLESGDFLFPASRRKEMLNNFVKPGLQDLCVSRTSFDWGVKVPFDQKHVIYVWLDALFNYVTALGYMGEDDELFKKYWPASVHMMAKEIVRFHSVIWPAFLTALDLPLPKKVFGHGWIMFDGGKMSKSKGNVVDPFILSERYGVDTLRYYLLHIVPFGEDGEYSNEMLVRSYNSDLANTLGNLVSRVAAMIDKYFGVIPAPAGDDESADGELKKLTEELLSKVRAELEKPNVSTAMDAVWEVLHRANKYIDETAPWTLGASEEGKVRLSSVLFNLAEAIRTCAVVLQAFLPETAKKILDKLGVSQSERTFDSLSSPMSHGGKVDKGAHLFARLDVEKELKELEKIAEELASAKEKKSEKPEAGAGKNEEQTPAEIGIEDFDKVVLKVGKILNCKKVEKADKLLCSTVDLGEEKPRTIVSGIAKYYSPEEMKGKSVVVVANLRPVKLRGILSQGMLLCASDKQGGLKLLTPEGDMPAGSEIS